MAGRLISTAVGAVETFFGVTAIMGGSALMPPTAAAGGACAAATFGWCIPIGIAGLALEASVVVADAVVAAHGIGVLAQNITQLLQFSRGSSGRTSSPNRMDHEVQTGRAPRGF